MYLIKTCKLIVGRKFYYISHWPEFDILPMWQLAPVSLSLSHLVSHCSLYSGCCSPHMAWTEPHTPDCAAAVPDRRIRTTWTRPSIHLHTNTVTDTENDQKCVPALRSDGNQSTADSAATHTYETNTAKVTQGHKNNHSLAKAALSERASQECYLVAILISNVFCLLLGKSNLQIYTFLLCFGF